MSSESRKETGRKGGATAFGVEQLVSLTDPIAQFKAWFQDAQEAEGMNPLLSPVNAFLSTISLQGEISSRTVAVCKASERGFTFFTSTASTKAKELSENPRASLLFFWPIPIHRQVRVKGVAELVQSVQEVTESFHSFSRTNQIAITATSILDREISGRKELDDKFQEVAAQYPDKTSPLPVPPTWCGYTVVPHEIEFFQAYNIWTDDRIVFTKDPESGSWTIKRLAP